MNRFVVVHSSKYKSSKSLRLLFIMLFSRPLNNHVSWHGKDVTLFQKGQIIHQAKKTTDKQIIETTKIRLRTVRCINKTWNDSGEPASSRKIENILNTCDRRSLQRLLKWKRKKIHSRTHGYVYNESKIISTLTMWKRLKGLGLNNCVALRKPLISESEKKRLQFVREDKDWTLEQWNNFFSSLMAWACSKMTVSRLIRLKLWESGSGGAWDIIFTHGLTTTDLNPPENLWDVLQ